LDDDIFLFDGDCGMESKDDDDDVGSCCREEEVVTLFKLEDARSIYRACLLVF
jgi:hypothetical protein